MSDEAFLNNCLRFTRALRQAGLPLGVDQTYEFLRALEWIDIGSREQFYHTARSLLVRNHSHLRLFDLIFRRFWRLPESGPPARRQQMPRAPRHRPRQEPFTIVSYMAARARRDDPAVDISDKSLSYSPSELLQRKEFSAMTPEELERVRRLIQRLDWRVSRRITRRRRVARRGESLAMRRILREAARHGGAALRLPQQRRVEKPRPLVLIADISGSMEKYARLLLQLGYSLSRRLSRVECFVFGTRLTRISAQLRLRNIDRAIEEAAREVVDWAGGTRIGPSLHQFNRRWGRRVLGRGAVVLIVSDGWEQGDAELLAHEMRFLHGRCHRLIWLNPLLGRAGYRPLVGGMRAALRYIDDFLPAHNLQSLEDLARHIATLDERPGRRRPERRPAPAT